MSTILFQDTCRIVVPKLMKEFDWRDFQAAGCMGNLGHESGGLLQLREIGQPAGRGGYGWAQWTGPRARSFLHYCDVVKLQWKTTEANLGYLIHELNISYIHTVAAVAKTPNLVAATIAFERGYEAAGVVNMHSRIHWAEIALAAVRGAPQPEITGV